MNETDRLRELHCQNEALGFARREAQKMVKMFLKKGGVNRLIFRATTIQGLLKERFGLDPLTISVFITDTLAQSNTEGNRKIIEVATKVGVEPSPHMVGERLEALSCLVKILENPDIISST